ncbi:MAG: hypothetical protein V1787_06310, partial [Candidatus Micrarchaeota archaeon]
ATRLANCSQSGQTKEVQLFDEVGPRRVKRQCRTEFYAFRLATKLTPYAFAYSYAKVKHLGTGVLKAVLVGNAISLPLLWFIVPLFLPGRGPVFFFDSSSVGLVLSIAIEYVVLLKLGPEMITKDRILLTVGMNFVSLLLNALILVGYLAIT